MFGLLIYLLIAMILLSLLWWIATQIPLPPPVSKVLTIVFAVIGVLIIIYFLLAFAGMTPSLAGPPWRPLH